MPKSVDDAQISGCPNDQWVPKSVGDFKGDAGSSPPSVRIVDRLMLSKNKKWESKSVGVQISGGPNQWGPNSVGIILSSAVPMS